MHCFFRKEFQAFRIAASGHRTQPMDGFAIAYMGMMMGFAGDWERGVLWRSGP